MTIKKYPSIPFLILAAASVLMLTYCATPTQPTGGPRDQEGPQIVKTEPETGTVNFSGKTVVLHFDEFVNRQSLPQALKLQPNLGIEYDLDWGRKSVAVKLRRKLPDSTTAILTIGTDLKDMNGNKLSNPVQVAVSSGPRIDSGKLLTRLRTAADADKQSGWQVLLYREPVDLTRKARYVGETDTSGSIRFQYLSPGNYKAFWVDDRNRNQKWDPGQEWAQPFSREFVSLKKGEADTLSTLYVQQRDTTAPRLLGVGLLSSRRLRLRFSETVQWADTVRPGLTDTLGQLITRARPLYRPLKETFVMMARSKKDLDPQQTYQLQLQGVEDQAGNAVRQATQTFTGSAQKDTTLQRIIKNNAGAGLLYDQPLVVTYAAPITGNIIRDSLKVVEGDTLLPSWSKTSVDFNQFIISPKERWKPDINYQFRLWDPLINNYRQIEPQIFQADDFGGVDIVRADTTDSTRYIVELRNEKLEQFKKEQGSGVINIKQLPPGSYLLRAYIDRNSNGRWDPGTVDPYVAPEPYFVRKNVPVKPAMTGQVEIRLAP